jgi:hypothetical protein
MNVTGFLIALLWLNGSRVAIVCSVAAAWHNRIVRSERSERSEDYNAFSIQSIPVTSGPRTNDTVILSENSLALLTVQYLALDEVPALTTVLPMRSREY